MNAKPVTPSTVTNLSDAGKYITRFDKTGPGRGGVPFAQLHNVSVTMASLISQNAFHFNI